MSLFSPLLASLALQAGIGRPAGACSHRLLLGPGGDWRGHIRLPPRSRPRERSERGPGPQR